MDCEKLNNERLLNDECENLYYGFSSTILYENFDSWLQNAFKQILKELEESIIEMNICKNEEKPILHNQIHDIYKAYIQSAQEPLKKFKAEVQKLLTVPSNVALPGSELLKNYREKDYTDNDIIKMKKEISYLQERIIREKVFLAKLKQIKTIIDTQLQPKFNAINTAILSSKFALSSISERANKLLNMHEKSVKKHLEKISKNSGYLCNKETFF